MIDTHTRTHAGTHKEGKGVEQILRSNRFSSLLLLHFTNHNRFNVHMYTHTHTILHTSGTREESIAIFSTQIMRTAPRKKGVNRSSLSPSVVPPCFHEPYGSFSTTLNYALFTLFPSPFICLYTQFAIIPSQKGFVVAFVAAAVAAAAVEKWE